MRSWKVASSSVAAILVLGGCNTNGDPQPVALWDPCQIPAESVRAAGADPSTLSPDFLGGGIDSSDICAWQSSDRTLAVATTKHTFDEVQTNPTGYDFRKVVVGQRSAVSFLFTEDTSKDMCDVAFDTSSGVIIVIVTKYVSSADPTDPCVLATQAATVLDPVLPT